MSAPRNFCLFLVFAVSVAAPVGGQCGEFQHGGVRVQGTPGKRGEKGEQGKVDYERIYKRIDEKLETAFADMTSRLDKTIAELRAKRNSDSAENEGASGKAEPSFSGACDGVTYRGMCFWVELPGIRINFQKGESICKAKKGSAAGIYSEDHFELMSTYIRSQLPANTPYLDLWTGLRIIPETQEIDTGDSLRTYYTSWHPHYPSSIQGRTHIVWAVKRAANAQGQGMWNQIPVYHYNGILCQM